MVGFDEIPWADRVRPSLTTVVQPTYEEGRAAAELLTKRIADPARPLTRIILNTALRVRASSLRPAPADPAAERSGGR